jgi:hypothetical protein
MRISSLVLFAILISSSAFILEQGENVEFSCFKKHKASNTCHFNFIVDGQKHRFVDIGCKYEKKKEEVTKKAKSGDLALAKDWKIDCPEVKSEKDRQAAPGF